MATVTIVSDDGKLDSASAVLEVIATKPEYNQPALRIKQAGEHGAAASIRIDDPNPDIEFVETVLPNDNINPLDHGWGKYEIAVQSDQLQINGRKADGSRFETFLVFQRPGVAGNLCPQTKAGEPSVAVGNIGFGTKDQFGNGHGVIAIANACVSPSKNHPPAGGGILYVENGALMYLGSNGTITPVAPA